MATVAMKEDLFPRRPRPLLDEATWSYITRVAAANGFVSVGQLHARLKSPKGEAFRLLCERLALDAADTAMLQGPIPLRWGIRALPIDSITEDFNQTLRRWCPLCMRDSPHIRWRWTFKFSITCDRHGVLLHDRCPSCSALQKWGGVHLGRCICGTHLDTASAIQAGVGLLTLGLAVTDRDSNVGMGGSQLVASEWRRLVKYLGQFVDVDPSKPGQVAGLDRLDVALPLVQGASRLLADWPMRFREVLSRLLVTAKRTSSLDQTFAPLYGVLYRDLSMNCYGFLRAAFEEFLNEHWWGVVSRRNRRLASTTVASHPRVSLSKAARGAAISKAELKRLAQRELIPSEREPRLSGRSTVSFAQSDIPGIANLIKSALTLEAAAECLGLKRDRVRQLVDAKELQALVRGKSAGANAWRIAASELERLYFHRSPPAMSDGHVVDFNQAMQMRQIDRAEFAAVVTAIRQGEVRVFGDETTATPIGNLLLHVGDFGRWIEARRAGQSMGLSLHDAAIQLRVKEQVVSELAHRGLITVFVARLGRRVMFEEVARFRNAYVSLVEMARQRGTSSRALLATIGAEPVCGPSIDGARQYFFRRADVDGVASPGAKIAQL